ncbi:hypothetical protein [Rhodoferax aquaticus]|uniref:Uncharacterized protein n=1 Tax=Rhodoferax aquaticus TaxID=2527691 RepID=A0A515EJE1_9BURK|nr:hypothetical protein [Rhodoferax aquaticus]QDL52709.1 hypothetical protein EXZ61_00155 [Rhodoferax aquaticus]
MQTPLRTAPDSTAHTAPQPADGEHCDTVLRETDLKWLLTGLGWWIDANRLHSDANYARTVVHTAMQSGSDIVRQSAVLLHMQLQAMAVSQAAAQSPETPPQQG